MAQTPKTSQARNPLRSAALILLGIATLISGYLAVQSMRSAGIPGCDAGNCAIVLSSKWSKALGVPVGLFGAATYALLLVFGARPIPAAQRGPRIVATTLALLIPGAAAWFVALQIWILKAFCPWCCTTHAIATLGSLLLFAAWRRDAAPVPAATAAHSASGGKKAQKSSRPAPAVPVWPAAAALGAVVLGGMILVQSLSPEPPKPKTLRVAMDSPAATAATPMTSGTSPSPAASSPTLPTSSAGSTTPASASPATSSGRRISLHDGRFQLDPHQLPILGSPDATNMVVMLSDYTCKYCRATHKMLGEVRDAFSETELAFIMLPSHHGGDSQAIQEMMLATWQTDPKVWHQVADDLYLEKLQPKPDVVRATLTQQLGAGRLDAALASQRLWTTNLFTLAREVHAANKAKAGSGSIPQLIIGKEILVGAPSDAGEVFNVLEQNFALVRRSAPELHLAVEEVNLGRVFAGTLHSIKVGYTNTGQGTLQITRAKMPPGGRIGKGLMSPVASGQSASVDFTFGVPREEGAFHETVTLFSNARKSSAALQVKGTAWKPLRITPEILDFGRLDADNTATQAVMRIELQESVPVASVRSQNPGFAATLREITPGRVYEIDVATTASLGAGRQQGVLRLAFQQPIPPGWPDSIAVSARAEVDRVVSVSPPRINLPAGTLTADRHHQVLVRCSDGTADFQVTGAVLEGGPAFSQPQIQKSNGTDHVVIVNLPSGWTPPAPPSGARLVIHTNHPRYPVVEVPFVVQP